MNISIDMLGMKIKYKKWNGVEKLPLYLSSGYNFRKAEIDLCECLLIEPKVELPTLPALKKQIVKIQQVENIPVVICLDNMSSFRRKNMIENRIPFIVKDKQVYLPFMGTFLQAKSDKQIAGIGRFMISTQLVFLLYVYRKNKELYLSYATKYLKYSAMTINRATKQLERSKLFQTRKDGVNKILFSELNKSELYEKIRGYLISPIVNTYYLSKNLVTNNMTLAGTSALSEQSMLSESTLMCYAIEQGDTDKNGIEIELLEPQKQVLIEEWSYSPQLFAREGIADPISIALSLADNEDERVEMAIEEMLNALWEEIDG